MDKLIKKMDSIVLNENGHPSLSAEGVGCNRVAFFSKLMRGTSSENIHNFLGSCLEDIKNLYQQGRHEESHKYFLDIIVMMVQTRDIINGKGERQVFYDFFLEIFKILPTTASSLLPTIPMIYGSWLDINNLWIMINDETHQLAESDSVAKLSEWSLRSGLENMIIKMWSNQLQEDLEIYETGKSNSVSLAVKWAPRIRIQKNKKTGKSKTPTARNDALNKLAKKIAIDIFGNKDELNQNGTIRFPSMESVKNDMKKYKKGDPYYNQLEKTLNRSVWNCYKRYRKLCSSINLHMLKTVETKMCDTGKVWDTIDPSTVPARALKIYRSAFQNIPTKKQRDQGSVVRSYDRDRIECAQQFQQSTSLKGAKLQIHELVTQVLSLNDDTITQKQYDDIIRHCFHGEDETQPSRNMLENSIIMCDTSSSMEWSNSRVKPIYSAIGLSEIASQITKPPFKNRILTFSTDPEWVVLPETTYMIPEYGEKKIHEIERTEWEIPGIRVHQGGFRERIHKIKSSNWGGATSFHKAMDLILHSCLEADLRPDEIEKLTLFVFSDMQFDCSFDRQSNWDHEYRVIEESFKDAGLKSRYRTPFPVPFIIFWNLNGNTVSNPVTADQPGVAYISGFSQAGFNGFLDGSLMKLKTQSKSRPSPYDIFRNTMDNDRYDIIRSICYENFDEFWKYLSTTQKMSIFNA